MHVHLLGVGLALGAVADVERARLVVGAVGARHQLLVLALEGKPGLEVVLLGRRVVERARDDGHDAVGDAERLVEGFRDGDHVVEGAPGVVGFGEEELLDLICFREGGRGKGE